MSLWPAPHGLWPALHPGLRLSGTHRSAPAGLSARRLVRSLAASPGFVGEGPEPCDGLRRCDQSGRGVRRAARCDCKVLRV